VESKKKKSFCGFMLISIATYFISFSI
jgi:tau tubulin kinase